MQYDANVSGEWSAFPISGKNALPVVIVVLMDAGYSGMDSYRDRKYIDVKCMHWHAALDGVTSEEQG